MTERFDSEVKTEIGGYLTKTPDRKLTVFPEKGAFQKTEKEQINIKKTTAVLKSPQAIVAVSNEIFLTPNVKI